MNMESSNNFTMDKINEEDSLKAAIEISKLEEVERILRKYFLIIYHFRYLIIIK